MPKCGNRTLLVAQLAVDLCALIPPLHAMIADYLWDQKRCEMVDGWISSQWGRNRYLTYACGCKHGLYAHCFERKIKSKIEVLEFIKRDKQGALVFRDIKYDTFLCIYPTGYTTKLHRTKPSELNQQIHKRWYDGLEQVLRLALGL
jgi:hypothetical protein